jgi:hypothetical protein
MGNKFKLQNEEEVTQTQSKGKIRRGRRRIYTAKPLDFPSTVISRNSIFDPTFQSSTSLLVLLKSSENVCFLFVVLLSRPSYFGITGLEGERMYGTEWAISAKLFSVPVRPSVQHALYINWVFFLRSDG